MMMDVELFAIADVLTESLDGDDYDGKGTIPDSW